MCTSGIRTSTVPYRYSLRACSRNIDCAVVPSDFDEGSMHSMAALHWNARATPTLICLLVARVHAMLAVFYELSPEVEAMPRYAFV